MFGRFFRLCRICVEFDKEGGSLFELMTMMVCIVVGNGVCVFHCGFACVSVCLRLKFRSLEIPSHYSISAMFDVQEFAEWNLKSSMHALFCSVLHPWKNVIERSQFGETSNSGILLSRYS